MVRPFGKLRTHHQRILLTLQSSWRSSPPLDARCLGKHNEYQELSMPRGVVVARQPLELESLVRAQAGQPPCS